MANDRRVSQSEIWAVIPVKGDALAKQRLADALSPRLRKDLALAMFEDVLEAVMAVPPLPGIAVVTGDRSVAEMARRSGAAVCAKGAHGGHPGAVRTAARRLAATSSTMLTLPGNIPLVSSADISRVLAAHLPA